MEPLISVDDLTSSADPALGSSADVALAPSVPASSSETILTICLTSTASTLGTDGLSLEVASAASLIVSAVTVGSTVTTVVAVPSPLWLPKGIPVDDLTSFADS